MQWLTLAVVLGWIAAVVVGSASLGLAAFAASVVLIIASAADEGTALKRMPWAAILMVCGVAMLVPEAVLYRPPGQVERMHEPGAAMRWAAPAAVVA